MAVSARTLARIDLVKTCAIVINTHHKTERTGGVLTPVTLRITDARHLRDADNVFISRLLPGYTLEESTGARSAPAVGQPRLSKGTSIKGGTEPNGFSCTITNAEGPGGQTLDHWQNYALKGSEIIVYRGAVRNGAGASYAFSDYAEVFYGWITGAQRTTEDWQIRADSPEGRAVERTLVRRSYQGLGYGWKFDNTAGTLDDWGFGVNTNTFTPATGGKYAFSGIFHFLALPSSVVGVVAMTVWSYGVGALDVIAVKIRESDDALQVLHDDGVGSATHTFTWKLTAALLLRPIALGIRHDGTEIHLYVDGELEESVAATRVPSSTATDFFLAQSNGTPYPGSFTCFDFWISDDDPGDSTMRARQAGPLVYDRANQVDLWSVYKFLEGGLASPSKTADLTYDGGENDLQRGGGAIWVSSGEGDDPGVGGGPRGDSKPFVLGRVFNFPAAFVAVAGVAQARPVYGVAPWALTYSAARVSGSPLQIGFTETGTFALRTNLGPDLRSAIESESLARVCIRPVQDLAGARLLAGSQIEISGGHAQDGIWYCTGVEGERFVFVDDGAGGGFSAEDLSASITVTVPAIAQTANVIDQGDGTITTNKVYVGQIAVDAERGGTSPTATAALIFLRNARDRAETDDISTASFSAGHSVTWVGATGERDEPWALGIPSARDISFKTAFAQLLESFFMWTSDTARVGGNQGVRAGQFSAPAGGGTAYRADAVVEGSIQELDTLPPAWRVVVRYRPNYSTAREGQITAVVSPAERAALSRDYSEIEILRDTTIRDDFDGAREVIWETNFWNAETAMKVGRRVAEFLRVPRSWWRFRMHIRPEAVLIGEEISIPHERFAASGSTDMIVTGKLHGITGRGVDLVTVS